jgi:hypothetical protein
LNQCDLITHDTVTKNAATEEVAVDPTPAADDAGAAASAAVADVDATAAVVTTTPTTTPSDTNEEKASTPVLPE